MKKIKIPFNDWSMIKLKHSNKECTSRTKKYGNEGDIFTTDFENFRITYRITHILKLPLWIVRDFLYKAEGAESPHIFENVWNEIHPIRRYQPNDMVFVHFFEIAETKQPI